MERGHRRAKRQSSFERWLYEIRITSLSHHMTMLMADWGWHSIILYSSSWVMIHDRLRADLSTWGFWGSVMACMSTTQNICESLFSSATFIFALLWCELFQFPFFISHLQPSHPTLDSPKVVAQVEHPSGLDSRKRPRRVSRFQHWGIAAAVPLIEIWQGGIPIACQETHGGRRKSWDRIVQLVTAKLPNSGKIHLIWKVLKHCYYLVRL